MQRIMKVAYLLGCIFLVIITTFSIVNAQNIIKLQRTGDFPEAVTAPNVPSGPTDSNVGISCIYTITGSSTNLGDPIQYFVDWGDGTNTGWIPSSSNITSPNTNYLVSKLWASPGIYSVKAKARCAINTTIESGWSETLLVTISIAIEETISTLSIQGPTNGDVNTNYIYTTGGASSNVGHIIEYQFDWGDGSYSSWSSLTSVSKSWSPSGIYIVKVQARCSVHTSIVSEWSVGILISIGSKNGWTFISLSTGGVLNSVHFTSTKEGWAVGYDKDSKGLALHYLNGSWEKVTLPDVNSVWIIRGVHFTSSNEGWAVGRDLTYGEKGLLLHYFNGTWTVVSPPNVNSTNWYLSSVYFTSPEEGWAVGCGSTSGQGILLHYLNGVWNSLTTPFLSVDWCFSDVNLTSSNEGWAVGFDDQNQRGVLFHYLNGSWTSLTPPNVSSYWSLSGVHFTSSNEGWAAGSSNSGVFLHYLNGSWEVVSSPVVSSDSRSWLNSVHFTSSQEGWAIGVKDYDNHPPERGKGLLLHYSNGNWIEVIPPDISSLWQLLDVYFPSSEEGWAVGYNRKGPSGVEVVLLKYSASSEIISIPTTPSGPSTGSNNNPYSYSTGGSTSNLGHTVDYQFDWKGDGSDLSPWGSSTQSKTWTVLGTYNVRARARCATDTSVISDWSLGLTVTINGISITSPNGGENWKAGTTQTISWTYTGNPGKYVKIELLKGEAVNRTIAYRTNIGSGGSGSYSWRMLRFQTAGSDYKIRVTSFSNSSYTDTSDNNFTISK